MITFLANLVIPLFIFTLVLYGTLKRKDIYTPFLEGVMDGFKIVLEIAPTLIALAGFMSSVILSSTETCFYTLSVYYSVVGIKKIRYTLTGALLAVFVGTFISVFISYF